MTTFLFVSGLVALSWLYITAVLRPGARVDALALRVAELEDREAASASRVAKLEAFFASSVTTAADFVTCTAPVTILSDAPAVTP